MGKSLVIVESPAKAHTINKYLGSNYVVRSSVGHIRDLPSGQTKKSSTEPVKRARSSLEKDAKLFARMGINPEKPGWDPQYEILPGKEKVVAELISEAKKCDYVYLATDLDREGEAIAWHLQEVIGLPKDKFRRVTFTEITEKAIKEAFEKPVKEVDMNMVNAQQTRRFLDRVVGFMVSPLLWEKVGRGLSAGRVQSVAVRLIAEREKEIRAFVPKEYWNIHALLAKDGNEARFELKKYQGKDFHSGTEAETNGYLEELRKQTFKVVENEEKDEKIAPYAPLKTSTMQRQASYRLGFSVKKTMMLAQTLYEKGYITYMRTDSLNLSAEAVDSVRKYISAVYGKEYVPAKVKVYKSDKNAQGAHEAIRPTDINRDVAKVASELGNDAAKLYTMIRNYTLICQMSDALSGNRKISVQAGDFRFETSGKVIKFDGWTKIYAQKDVIIPDMAVGDVLQLVDLPSEQRFTPAPARFTEASLVKELEDKGIGRPSTYATIVSTIQERGYVRLEQRRFFAEKMGEIVTDRLMQSFSRLMNYEFTKNMESELDDIAADNMNWIECLDNFYKGFKEKLDTARLPEDEGGMHSNVSVVTSVSCPECGSNMVIKNATTGVFLACSNYAGKGKKAKDSCRKTINLVAEDQLPIFENEDSESEYLRTKRRCPECGCVMLAYIIDEHRKIHICSDNPNCKGYEIEEGNFRIKGAEGPTIVCDRCGKPMVLKTGRFGSYMSCSNTECGNTRKILKNGEVAPPREDPVDFEDLICKDGKSHFVLRDGAAGIFLASNAFPKVRETRAPKVCELVAHKDALPEKFKYFTKAPVTDADGNLTVVRFSRKTKKQYIIAENADGKSTGFTAFYDEASGEWQVTEPEKSAKSKGSRTAKTTKTAAKTTRTARTARKKADAGAEE